VRVARGPATWAKRAFVAIVLVGAAVIPGRASSGEPQHCAGIRCRAAGSILWTAGLPGLWLAQPGVSGTVPAKVGAYAATGGGVAVIGAGTGVTAFDEGTGKRLWRVALTGLPAGSAVVGVRAFQQIIAVGVAPPGRLVASQRQSARGGKSAHGLSPHVPSGAARYEVMLSAATGRQIQIYPAATYGGAVAADSGRTVIVGTDAITAYDNATGRAAWSRAIGPAGEAWRVTGDTIYLAGASAGGAGKTTLRRIDLRTGAEVKRTLSALGGTPPGSLSDAAGNVVLFSGSAGVAAYDGSTGKLLWCMANSTSCAKKSRVFADVELADSGQPASAYLASGNRLIGVNVATGKSVSSAPISVASSLYAVISGVALGLDEDGLGEAWGYKLKTRRIVWTSASLPWPHYFVDLSGLGGSISLGSTIALLATCPDVGAALSPNSAPVCRRPELEAVRT
jgi:outer membrane protein assembly factor BamB